MARSLFIGNGITVKDFESRVLWLNQALKYFPMVRLGNGQYRECKPLDDDQICDILNVAKKPE